MKIQSTDWLLIQFSGTDHEKAYGPFDSEERAWRYLFGRESSDDERVVYRAAKWRVCQVEEPC